MNAARENKFSNTSAIVLTAILVLATILRIYHIGFASVWIDEIASMEFSAGWSSGDPQPPLDFLHQHGTDLTGLSDARSLPQVWHSTDQDTHPPLYNIILRVWRDIFGSGDVAARSLSALCTIISILLLYDTARLLHDRSVALWAAAIMTVATPQIVFAQEARSYAMLAAMILAIANSLAGIEKLGISKPRLFALAFSTFAAAMTHYLAIPAALAMGIYALLRCGRSALLAMCIVGAMFLLLCGPTVWQQRDHFRTNLNWVGDDQIGKLIPTLGRLALLPLRFLITPKQHDFLSPIAKLGAIFYLMPLMWIRRRDLLLWILLAGAIIATVAISDVIQHRRMLEFMRYPFPAAAAFYALIAAASASLPRKWIAHAVPGAIVLCCIAALPEAYNQYWKPNYRAFAAAFDRDAGPDDVIVIPFASHEKNWPDAIVAAAITHYSSHPNRPTIALSKPASESIRAALSQAPNVWMVGGSESPDLLKYLPGAKIVEVHDMPNAGAYLKLQLP